jgi:mono/diheme cytochrome c family protein
VNANSGPMPTIRHDARRATRVARRALLFGALPLALGACSWFTDFKQQPKVDPWESASDTIPFRGNPQMSVPVTGTFAAGFQVSYRPFPQTVDSMSGIQNPTPASDSSLANGRKYYQINCAVCHGDQGMGNGPATRYGMPGISIGANSPAANVRTDGYIFGMIRNGRGLMPSYDRIEEMDRWDVVNYLRGLQGKLGRTVAVGPVGYPGQTGAAVPGASRMAPTRPAPYLKPTALNTGGVTGVAPSGPMETGRGAPTTPGGAADTTGGAAHQPTPPGAPAGAPRPSDSSAARKTGGAQ